MKVDRVFLSVNARDFDAQMQWWAHLLDRRWDREPMPSCREWDLADGAVLFQVLDSAEGAGGATVTLHVDHLDPVVKRLRDKGVVVPDPVKVEGFHTLRYCEFTDPEGNKVGLLDGG
jgi:predicted enzyme related to lactoylglutathione lyase